LGTELAVEVIAVLVGDFQPSMAVVHQARIRFGATLHGSGLSTPRSIRDQIGGQHSEQFRHQVLALVAEPECRRLKCWAKLPAQGGKSGVRVMDSAVTVLLASMLVFSHE
jgi:hypothetical protein